MPKILLEVNETAAVLPLFDFGFERKTSSKRKFQYE